MEKLRRLMSRSEDHPWRTLNDKWRTFINSSHDLSLRANTELNPWEFWCESWEVYKSSASKPPKSGKKKIGFWQELYSMARDTSYIFEEVKAISKELKQQANKLIDLQQEKKDLERHLQVQLDCEQRNKITEDHVHKEMLKKEVNRRQSLEEKNMRLQEELEQKHAELKGASIELKELECKITDLQRYLDNMKAHNSDQRNNGKEIVRYDPKYRNRSEKFEGGPLLPETTNGSLDLATIKHMSDILPGKITSDNAVDWLCDCEDLGVIWCWNPNDFAKILRSCMDPSTFTSLSTKVKMGRADWLATCREILDRLNTPFVKEMEEDSSVLQFFRHVWLLYRVQNVNDVSKNDSVYLRTLFKGLTPFMKAKVGLFENENFDQFQKRALLAECSWKTSQERQERKLLLVRKAGAGCPSRYKIWKRLEHYMDPCIMLDNAPYWKLLVELSKHENL